MILTEILDKAVEYNASDIHLLPFSSPVYRINGILQTLGDPILTDTEIGDFIKTSIVEPAYMAYITLGETDAAFEHNTSRFRINAFKQMDLNAVAIRIIPANPPSLSKYNYAPIIEKLTHEQNGLILVTGATGSGKSTTLASMVNEINEKRAERIITLEDPIEYIHKNKKSYISQREIGADSKSYANALRATLREDPDVILVGEMRDYETISIALTAAETGHLVLSTLHTMDAINSISRIIDAYPAEQQDQARTQLRNVLKAVISQKLIPDVNGKRVCVQEILINNSGIGNLIKENKIHQIRTQMQTNVKSGNQTMDQALKDLYKNRAITLEVMKEYLQEL